MVTSVSDIASYGNEFGRAVGELEDFILQTCSRADESLDYLAFEREVRQLTAGIEKACHAQVLESLDNLGPRVEYEGRLYRACARVPKTYRTLAGRVTVKRTLYREAETRNGRTLDAVGLRAGLIGGTWTPAAAQAMAYLLQLGTSREAQQVGTELGCLPYSRSSFERIGHELGQAHVRYAELIQSAVQQTLDVPAAARSLAISIDRTSVPLEEIAEDGERVERNYRMAYCASISLNDENGDALKVLRYARMPKIGTEILTETMKDDLRHILEERANLRVVLLADGAKEMWRLMGEAVEGLVDPLERHQVVDFWHLAEKLGLAIEELNAEKEDHQFSLDAWKLRLLNEDGAVNGIYDELYHFGGTPAVDDAIIYMRKNKLRMEYARARANGLPVGSGNVEATCKLLITQRLKRSGSRWKLRTGQHILQMRALALNDHWSVANRALFSALSGAKVCSA